jgi:hypothetical protein
MTHTFRNDYNHESQSEDLYNVKVTDGKVSTDIFVVKGDPYEPVQKKLMKI